MSHEERAMEIIVGFKFNYESEGMKGIWMEFSWDSTMRILYLLTYQRYEEYQKKYSPIGWLWVVIMKGIVNLLGLLADKWDRGRFHGSNDWNLRLETTKSPMHGGLYPNYTPSMEPQKTRNNMKYMVDALW